MIFSHRNKVTEVRELANFYTIEFFRCTLQAQNALIVRYWYDDKLLSKTGVTGTLRFSNIILSKRMTWANSTGWPVNDESEIKHESANMHSTKMRVIAGLMGQFGCRHFKEVHAGREKCRTFITKYLSLHVSNSCTLYYLFSSCKSSIVDIVIL